MIAAGDVNVYDVRKKCHTALCYDEFEIMDSYLNRPEVRKALGVGNRKWEVRGLQIGIKAVPSRFLPLQCSRSAMQSHLAAFRLRIVTRRLQHVPISRPLHDNLEGRLARCINVAQCVAIGKCVLFSRRRAQYITNLGVAHAMFC